MILLILFVCFTPWLYLLYNNHKHLKVGSDWVNVHYELELKQHTVRQIKVTELTDKHVTFIVVKEVLIPSLQPVPVSTETQTLSHFLFYANYTHYDDK